MSSISIQQPPESFEGIEKDYLVRQLVQINLALGQANYFTPRNNLPLRVRVGEVFYFNAAIPTTPITGEGLWIYKSTGWTQII